MQARINIKVEIDSEQDKVIVEKMNDFSFKVTDASENHLTISVDLAYPELFSLDEKDYLLVCASFSDFEPGWNDEKVLLRVEIPRSSVKAPEVAA